MSMMPPSPDAYAGLDCLSTGVMVLDGDDCIVHLNPAAETLLGVSGALLAGQHTGEAFERSPELLAAIRTVRDTQETVIEHELDVAGGGGAPQKRRGNS